MSKKTPKNEIVSDLNPKYWVQKSDPLVLMRSVPFSLGELKILDTYISRINASDDTRRTVIFTKEEYEELMGLTCVDYRTLKKHTEGMLGKVVTLEMPNKEYLQFVLFEQARYHKDEYGKPIIELTCTSLAKDLFFCIGKYHYFKYALENVIKLTRKASYLLYIYIRYNRYRGNWDIDLAELRDTVLDCKGQSSYQEFKIFKNRILNPAVKEINEKTDCHFEYEPVKRGRRVAKIKFIYHVESQLQEQHDIENVHTLLDQDIDDEAYEKIYGSEQLAQLASSCNYEFSKAQMEEIFFILTRTDVPPDPNTKSVHWGRFRYLSEKYAVLNATSEKKKLQNQTPIKNRYAYFKKLLEEEANDLTV